MKQIIEMVGGGVAAFLLVDGIVQHFFLPDPCREAPRKIASAAGLILLLLIAKAVSP